MKEIICFFLSDDSEEDRWCDHGDEEEDEDDEELEEGEIIGRRQIDNEEVGQDDTVKILLEIDSFACEIQV